ncbi:excinuclease ABC subunit UvrC [bacterium]|nr:excinuclease ABC subunit UvrC [bacterium]
MGPIALSPEPCYTAPAMREELKARINQLPDSPGVNLMKDAYGAILYIGKAKSRQKRVRSHFTGPRQETFKAHVATIDVLLTDTEGEALLLEHTLVQKHLPRYNVQLKDDKRYPYIKLSWNEDYPRLTVVRRAARDGASYFGPFPSVRPARFILRALHEIFPIRSCKYPSHKLNLPRPCIDYEMGRCVAPCIAAATRGEYRDLCRQVEAYLLGRRRDVRAGIEKRMQDFAARQMFEKAAFYRDMLTSMDKVVEKQKMIALRQEDEDYLALARFHDVTCMTVMRRYEGKLSSGEHYFLKETEGVPEGEIFAAFILQHYAFRTTIPHRLLCSSLPDNADTLESWLAERAERAVEVRVPQRGDKRAMLALAEKNAAFRGEERYRKLHGITGPLHPGLVRLAEHLGLSDPPMRIECYDISNLQGKQAVGSLVVFRGGRPQKSSYRKFKIRREEFPDDYAMMAEMLSRRFTHGLDLSPDGVAQLSTPEADRFAEPPHLVVVDGGLGHLHAARKAMEAVGAGRFPTISLAKEEELVFTCTSSQPLRMERDDPALHLLQAIRDEAHRFAVTYHRALRRRLTEASTLDAVPGVGRARKLRLIRHFGSLEGLSRATPGEIARVPGISVQLAQRIHAQLAQGARRAP